MHMISVANAAVALKTYKGKVVGARIAVGACRAYSSQITEHRKSGFVYHWNN